MSADRVPVFRCGACNKGYVWKPASAGKVRVCECGEFVPVPKMAPASVARAGSGDAGGTRFVDTASGATVTSAANSFRANAVTAPTATDTLAGWEVAANEPPPANAIPKDKAAMRELLNAALANAAPVKTEEEKTYDIKQAAISRRPRNPSMDVSIDRAAKEIANGGDLPIGQAFLADHQSRVVRERFAAGPVMREWIGPSLAIVVGAVICSFAMQMYLTSTDLRAQHMGRMVAAYLVINVIGVAAGVLIAFFLANVRFGRPLNAVLKFLGIALVTPAMWVAVLKWVVDKNMAGDTSLEAGAVAGWAVELALIYTLVSTLFDLEQFDAFWTVAAISIAKIVLFVLAYVVRSFLIY